MEVVRVKGGVFPVHLLGYDYPLPYEVADILDHSIIVGYTLAPRQVGGSRIFDRGTHDAPLYQPPTVFSPKPFSSMSTRVTNSIP